MPHSTTLPCRLFYETSGRDDAPWLLLMNGITMNTAGWTLLMPHLEPHFHVLRLDFPGQGASDKPEQDKYPLTAQADAAAALLAELGIERVQLVGLSYGGMVAQHFTHRHPRRVERLTLAATLAWSDAVNRYIHESWLACDDAGGYALRFDTGLPWLFSSRFLASQAALLPALKEATAIVDWPAAVRLSRGVLDHDARNWLSTFHCPTQVLVGNEDRLTPLYQAHLLASSIPHARLQVLEGQAHALHLEAPEAFARAVVAFGLEPQQQ